MANEQHTAQLDWSGADEVSVQSANTVMVQGLGDELTSVPRKSAWVARSH